MKKLFKIMAVVLAVGLILAVNAVPAFATEAYTAVNGSKQTFTKYFAIEEGANVPNKTFDFEITAGEAVSATSSSMAILAGVGTPTITDPVFSIADTSSADSVANASPTDDVALTAVASELSGMVYVSKEVEVDFSGVSFPEPGIYRYVITETALTAPYYIVDAATKYMDVYVVDNNGTLVVDSYILHPDDAAPALNTTGGTEGGAMASKTDGFVNKYETVDLGFSKRISGNQAAKDKYFKFTVQLTEGTVLAGGSDEYIVEIDGAEASPTGNAATTYATMTNPTTVTGDQLVGGVDFFLNDGQYILIKNLPKGITYTVTEVEEDYVKTEDNDVQGDGSYTDANTGTLDDDKFVGYTNTREGIIPTGVILTVAPFMIGLLVFGAVMMFVISRRRRAAY